MSSGFILLDTHAVLWVGEPERLAAGAEAALKEAQQAGAPVLMSPISAWEIGQLAARGRISLPAPPGLWIQSAIENSLSWAPMDPQVLVDASFLPGDLHRDPADRILVATARAYGYRLMTRDRALLDYAEAGHLRAIPC